MVGSKEEYFIWDQRFQLGYSCLDERLQKTERAMQQQIAQLNEQTKQLAASTRQLQEDNSSFKTSTKQLQEDNSSLRASTKQLQKDNSSLRASTKRLQEDNSSLRDRIQQLEQTSSRIPQLDEQIQDLAASSSDLKERSNDSNYSILQIEQEGTYRDQQNRLVQKQLEEKLEKLNALKVNVDGVAAAMTGMNKMVGLERAQRVEEMQHLRSQVGKLIAAKHTIGDHVRDASTDRSRASTEDEGIQVNNHPEQQQAAQKEFETQGVLIKAQASSTLFEDHLRYAEKAFKQCETEAALAFVSSLREKYRITLEDRLEKHGEWTWQAAMEEAYQMAEAEQKIPRRSARLIASPSQLT